MKSLSIYFFSEDINYVLKKKNKIRRWIHQVILKEGHTIDNLNFIFCSDDYLLNINQKYLKHRTYTDIITFDNSDVKGLLRGDIFISLDRIFDNAEKFNVKKLDETYRVMVHGILHLLGYKDKTRADKIEIHKKEEKYLNLIELVR